MSLGRVSEVADIPPNAQSEICYYDFLQTPRQNQGVSES